MTFQTEVGQQSNVLRTGLQQASCFELPRKYQLKKKTDCGEETQEIKVDQETEEFCERTHPNANHSGYDDLSFG
jgi:hypothetical protein